MRKGRKSTKRNATSIAHFEQLEARELYSVVTVAPGSNVGAIIAASNPGDTISFTAGTYNVSNLSLPGNRVYQGNGVATIAASGSTPTFNINGVTGVEVTGFTFTGQDIAINNAAVNVHGNTFKNISGNAILATGIHDSQINNNTFTNVSGSGVMAYPGNNNTFDYNSFTDVFEPIHLFDGNNSTSPGEHADTIDVSYNTIIGASRNAIELQSTLTNLTVTHNYVAQWNLNGNIQSDGNAAHMAISCATGGSPTAPYNRQGENITIADNTLLLNGRNGQTADTSVYALTGIEIMGDKNINIVNNYVSGAGLAIMNGTTGAGVYSNGNTFVCVMRQAADGVPWPLGAVTGTDQVYAWNASNAPAAPSIAATIGGSTSGSTGVTSAPTVAAPTNLAANSPSSSEVNLTWADPNSQATYILEREATHGTSGYQTVATLPAGTTSYNDTAVNPSWEYDYELVAVQNGADSSPATVHIQVEAAGSVTTPGVSTPTTPVVSAPVTSTSTTPIITTGTTAGSTVTTTATMIVAAPSNLTATSPGSSEIDLSWGDNTNGTATYVLQRKATRGSSGWQAIATLPAGTTSYADTSVNPTWEYNYQLVATVSGVASSPVTVHAQAQPVPAPSGLVVTEATNAQIDLSWIDNSDGQATYVLQRRASRGGAGFKTIATLAAGTTTYTDTGVNATWEYTYRLVAVENGISSSSVTAQAQAVISTPPAPSDFAATSPSSSEVDLSWADNSDGAATYVLERQATYGTAPAQIIATLPAGTTSYADTAVNADWEYDYSIVAVLPGSSSTAVGVHVQVQAASLGQLMAAA